MDYLAALTMRSPAKLRLRIVDLRIIKPSMGAFSIERIMSPLTSVLEMFTLEIQLIMGTTLGLSHFL